MTIESWGRITRCHPTIYHPSQLSAEISAYLVEHSNLLPYGFGRSYGDVCLNDDYTSVLTRSLKQIISFDKATGVICCEAGISLAELLAVCVPEGWFLPVTPGTKFVSVGGAIANDVHGKNHHRMGTFGRHLNRFQLIRSDGAYICSRQENSDLFSATIGGLGLTGLIAWAELRLKPIESYYVDVETAVFDDFDAFFSLADVADRQYEYTVAWVDTSRQARSRGRGIFIMGNHSKAQVQNELASHRVKSPLFPVPFDLPAFLSGGMFANLFNRTYFNLNKIKSGRSRQHYEPFFYPLDRVGGWNRFYGRRGFYQLQFVVPKQNKEILYAVLEEFSRSGFYSFLSVLKVFGQQSSPGLLSFPMPGYTLTVDLPNRGSHTMETLHKLNHMIFEAGGRIYPAKDASMTRQIFCDSYSAGLSRFEQFVDPHFTSSFWRRCGRGKGDRA